MADKQLIALQEEIKLLKGEVKQSLASVRDYLLNMELPSSEISTILAALGGDGEQKVTMKGSFDMPKEAKKPEPASDMSDILPEETIEEQEIPEEGDNPFSQPESFNDSGAGDDDTALDEMEPLDDGFEDAAQMPEDIMEPEDIMNPGEESYSAADAGLPTTGKEEPMLDYDNRASEATSSIPRVNMLANLIGWVSKAKKEVGYEQLPVFLEVYGVSGHLSPEMKDIILHLAEITAERPDVAASADVWSESMLSLHGILTGGEAPLHPMLPSWTPEPDIAEDILDEDILDEEEPEDQPVKLKLVFPNGNGEPKEFCIDLTPDMSEGKTKEKDTKDKKTR